MKVEERGKYLILWKCYTEGCGWVNVLHFVKALSLEGIQEEIGECSKQEYNEDAVIFEVKEINKPLFPEREGHE